MCVHTQADTPKLGEGQRPTPKNNLRHREGSTLPSLRHFIKRWKKFIEQLGSETSELGYEATAEKSH